MNPYINRLGIEFEATEISPGMVSLARNNYSVEVSLAALAAWERGDLVQDAFPDLDADAREFLISGMTPVEFEDMFGPDD